jgi:hypothetical protein
MNPHGASNQLMLSKWRGEVGHISINVKDSPNETVPDYDMVKNKSWILGRMDKIIYFIESLGSIAA